MLKKTVITFIAAGYIASAFASTASLTIDVTAIKEAEGAIMLAVYDAEETYNSGGPAVKGARIDVDGSKVSVTFDDLPTGRYAIKLYHDANSNGVLDTNMMGLPIESYGFSGGSAHVGQPPFNVAAFDVTAGDNSVTVRLR